MSGFQVALVVILIIVIAAVYFASIRPKYQYAGDVEVKVGFGDSAYKVLSTHTQHHVAVGSVFNITIPAGTQYLTCGIIRPNDGAKRFWTGWHSYNSQKNLTIKYGQYEEHLGPKLTGLLDLSDKTPIGVDRVAVVTLAQY